MRWGVLFGCAVAFAAVGVGCGSSTSIVLHTDAGNDTPSAAGGSGGVGATGSGGGASTGGANGTGGAPGIGGSGAGGASGSGGSGAGGASGSGGSGAGGAAVVDAGGDTPGIPCGNNVCTGAAHCCSPSCGICLPGGALCPPTCYADGGLSDARFSIDAPACAAVPALDTNCGGARPAHFYVCVRSALPPPCTVLSFGNVTNSFCCP